MSFWRNGKGKLSSTKADRCRVQNRLQAVRCACEALEQRTLFSTDTWIAGNGDWSTGANWSDGTPPASGENVVIDVPGQNILVTYTDPAVLQMDFPTFTNTEVLAIGGGGANWVGGTTWDGSGEVSNESTLTIAGSGDKTLKDGQAIDNDGTINFSGPGNIVGQVGASITDEPGSTFNDEGDVNNEITFTGGTGDGIFENAGTFIKSGAGISDIGGPQGFRFENSINDTSNETLSTPGDCQITDGTLALGDDQNIALTEGGTFEISPDATLDFNRGQHIIVVLRPPNGAPQVIPSITGPNMASGTGAGILEASGTASVQFYGVLSVDEVDVQDTATLLLQQNMTETAGTPQENTTPAPGTPAGTTNILDVSGGTFGGNGGGIFPVPAPISNEEEPALEVTSAFDWTGGSLSGMGRLQIDPNATSTIAGASPKAIDGGFGLDLFADTSWQGSGTIDMNGNSVLFIHSTGTLEDQGNGTIVQGSVDSEGGSIWNMGNLLKDGGTGTTVIGNGIDFINDYSALNYVTAAVPFLQPTGPVGLDDGGLLPAKLSIRTGTVSMQGTSLNRDNILISPGATLSYDAGVHYNQTYINSNDVVNASILGHDGGTLTIGDATFDSDSQSLIDVAQANFGSGTATFDNAAAGAQVIQNGVFNGGSTGTIGGPETLEVTGSFLWNSGTFSGTNAGTSTLLIDPGATLTIPSGNRSTLNSYSIDNDGTILWTTSPGVLNINGNYTQSSNGAFDCGFGMSMADELIVSGNVTIAGALNLNIGSTTFTNGELITIIDNTGSAAISGEFSGLTQGGTIFVNSIEFVVNYNGGDGNDLVLTAIVPPAITIATPDPFLEGESGTSNLIFTVSLSGPSLQSISVTYSTADITATAGVDYVATTGTLTIPAGQTTGSFAVPIIGSTKFKPTEKFSVTLSNPVNGILGTPDSAVATILNDNGPPVILLSQSSYTVAEDSGDATITVVRTNPNIAVTVQYSTTSGSAIAGVDFTAVTGTLSFGVGVSLLTFTVPIIPDPAIQSDKTFNVVLSNPQGGSATIGIPSAVVTIVNSSTPLPAISIGNATVTEPINGQINAVFNVTVSIPSASPITVHYATIDGTATAGSDYVAESGTLTFAPNQTTAQILVPVNSDFVQEETETFSVLLTNASTGIVFRSDNGTGMILNQPVNVVPIDALHPYHYTDARGNHATIILKGPGSGTIDYLGVPSDDAKELLLSGTTDQTQLMVRTTGLQTYLVNIVIDGSIKSIVGASLNLQGNLSVTGEIQILHMGSLMGGNVLSIGGGTGEFNGLSATFNQVTNATLTSAMPLTLLKVNNWQDSNPGTDITAPSAGVINSTGNFQGDVSIAGNLGSLIVGKSLNDSDILVGGSINVVSAGTMSGDTLFAGLPDTQTTLPTSTSEFANTSSSINKLTVTSKAANGFASTLIAAPTIGNVQLGSVNVSNGGNAFGVAGTSIRSVKAKNGKAVNLTDAGLQENPFSAGDLTIELTM